MYLALMMGAVAATHCPPVIGAGLPKAGTRSLAHYMHLALNYKTYKSAGGLVFETSQPGGLVFEREFLPQLLLQLSEFFFQIISFILICSLHNFFVAQHKTIFQQSQ